MMRALPTLLQDCARILQALWSRTGIGRDDARSSWSPMRGKDHETVNFARRAYRLHRAGLRQRG
jgi:hypothetical protein